MSVAFRRDNDEEHKEPRFEIPLPPGPNMVTSRGLSLIRERLAAAEAAIADAADDEAREAARREQRYWSTRAATAQLAPRPEPDTVAIGTQVRFRLAGRERTIAIVGHDEAEPHAERIAFSAPLAQAMIGAEVGERVDFNGRPEAIEVIAVDPLDD